MRQIVLDTETTGLEVTSGHRIIELAAVEIINRRPSGTRFHRYINPERDIEFGALEYSIADSRLDGAPISEVLSQQAHAFLESYLSRRARSALA